MIKCPPAPAEYFVSWTQVYIMIASLCSSSRASFCAVPYGTGLRMTSISTWTSKSSLRDDLSLFTHLWHSFKTRPVSAGKDSGWFFLPFALLESCWQQEVAAALSHYLLKKKETSHSHGREKCWMAMSTLHHLHAGLSHSDSVRASLFLPSVFWHWQS